MKKSCRMWLLSTLLTLMLFAVGSAALQAQEPTNDELPPSIYLPYISIPPAQTAQPDATDNFVARGAVTQAAAAEALPWTRERMLAAQPMPMNLMQGDPVVNAAAEDQEESGDSAPTYIRGRQALPEADAVARTRYSEARTAIEAAGQAEAVGAAETSAVEIEPWAHWYPFTSYFVTHPSYGGNLLYDEYPWRTMGVLFFTIPGYGDYRCSASVAYDNVLWTAGHCVYTPYVGWHDNVVFVPAYQDGYAPYGVFYEKDLATLNPWYYDENIAYDIGMVALWEGDYGYTVGETVGWLGSAFNTQPWRLHYNAFGYPSNLDNFGRYLMSCVAGRWLREDLVGPDSVAIGCDMTFGSSGGPWLIGFSPFSTSNHVTVGNYVVGVNSYGYSGVELMYSPYFGDGAQNMFWNWGYYQ